MHVASLQCTVVDVDQRQFQWLFGPLVSLSPNGCKYVDTVENYAMPCSAKGYISSLIFRQTAPCRSSSRQGMSLCWEAETKDKLGKNINEFRLKTIPCLNSFDEA